MFLAKYAFNNLENTNIADKVYHNQTVIIMLLAKVMFSNVSNKVVVNEKL